ncbi:MAG: cation transporter [Thermoleophilia bacterium]|nr:cation transporter [Thermoleophilia bacterium]
MTTALRELTVVGQPAQPARSQEWLRAARRARLLSWLSLAWMGTEGLVGIATGVVAGSIALTGFGINAFVEGFASVVIVWRFTGSRLHSERAEARAQRIVAVQFFVLAPYVAYEALSKLWHGDQPDTSWLGIGLVATSAVGMPLLGRAKRNLAHKLGSGATHGEGTQNLLCGYLAVAVLAGLLGNAVLGWWWLDPVAALAIAGLAVREGLESWRGESCGCATC